MTTPRPANDNGIAADGISKIIGLSLFAGFTLGISAAIMAPQIIGWHI